MAGWAFELIRQSSPDFHSFPGPHSLVIRHACRRCQDQEPHVGGVYPGDAL